jgi:hypothetical protein
MAKTKVSKLRHFLANIGLLKSGAENVPEAAPEFPAQETRTEDPFPNKVGGLSLAPMGKGWRTLVGRGRTGIFRGMAVFEKADLDAENAVRIDLVCGNRREKLGYLTASIQRICEMINSDSEMGRAITQRSIPCRVRIYNGDISAPCETDRYSYAHTDVVRLLKKAAKDNKKPKRKK